MPDKLCPMLKETRNLWENGEMAGTYEVPQPCIGEKCAWWSFDDCAVAAIPMAIAN